MLFQGRARSIDELCRGAAGPTCSAAILSGLRDFLARRGLGVSHRGFEAEAQGSARDSEATGLELSLGIALPARGFCRKSPRARGQLAPGWFDSRRVLA